MPRLILLQSFTGEAGEVPTHVGEQTVGSWAEEVCPLLLQMHQEDAKSVKETQV